MFNRQILTVEEALLLAQKARRYARSQIHESCTSLDKNELKKEALAELKQKIKDLRKEISLYQHQLLTSTVIASYSYSYYEACIHVTSVKKLGNCEEYAFQALHYIATHNPNVDAQICRIENGDHVFLALNHNYMAPKEWIYCEAGYICNPWAPNEKSGVFPISQYKTKLNDYYFGEDYKNHLRPLTPDQTIIDVGVYNTYLIQTAEKIYTIKKRIIEKYRQVISDLEKSPNLSLDHSLIIKRFSEQANELQKIDEEQLSDWERINELEYSHEIEFDLGMKTLMNSPFLEPEEKYHLTRHHHTACYASFFSQPSIEAQASVDENKLAVKLDK